MKIVQYMLSGVAFAATVFAAQAAELDPTAVQFIPAHEIKWVRNAAGGAEISVAGVVF